MPGKRPPPRGAPKGKGAAPHSKSSASSKGKPAPSKGKGGAVAKSQARPGVPQAAIDASNAARRAGLGSVARKGASEVVSPRKGAAPERNAPPRWTGDEWTDEGDVRQEARGAVERGTTKRPARTVNRDTGSSAPVANLPADVVSDFDAAAGPRGGPKLQQRFANARRAFERDRFGEARRLLEPLAREAPGAAGVRELYGLTLYRLGEYRKAAKELEAFRTLSSSSELNAVLADSYRALHRWTAVAELWDELRSASPDPAVVADGRIVMAGALADQGKLPAAIELLERGAGHPRRAQLHHLKQWYALADLYDRAGDVPRARSLFTRVRQADPSFADVTQRLKSLG
jgi:tetratricopeptide (TPR) repeat protein